MNNACCGSQKSTGPAKAVILSCEGACIKGEVARVAANILAYRLQRDSAFRICLGGAATKNVATQESIIQAPKVVSLEGCPLYCGTTLLKKKLPEIRPTIVDASKLYSFDRNKYFQICDLPRERIEEFAQLVADFANAECFEKAPHVNPNHNCK
ncbi:hypothetical protein SPSIL_036330 [Sporomusa silvacetica DSM 10669]|uniref:DGC domain protein n=1 Tax=Sporomusa silvacetica DSM 10669 TaxID=1123289 RepID=A0ABZ3IP00_9FIRM|nr:putative zinc-binding protein [Sporomusa silvacetica]OZC19816.1 DGC domain protein [Sporomusa silvacetica DSM 10669]